MNKEKIIAKALDIQKENEYLKQDKHMAYLHNVGITKSEFGQEPTKEQIDSKNHIKENYTSFFEDDSDEEDNFPKDSSKESKEREQLSGLMSYLKDEIRANKAQLSEMAKQNPELFNSDVLGNVSLKQEHHLAPEQESGKNRVLDTTSEGEPSKKILLEDSIDSSKTVTSEQDIKKEPNKSVHDYVENLPGDFNPFDDTGTD